MGALGVLFCVSAGACGDTSTTPGADDAAAGDSAVGDTSTTPPLDAAVPDTAPPRDAGSDAVDASAPIDAGADAAADAATDASADASDAADAAPPPCGAGGTLCGLGDRCAIDADCAAPNVCEGGVCAAEPTVRTLADIADLKHFDFEGATLVFETTTAPASAYTCTLPGCADGAIVPNITASTVAARAFPLAVSGGYIQYPGSGQAGSSFTVMQSRSLDGATAGPSVTFTCVDRLGNPTSPTIASAHSGVGGWTGTYKCLTDTRTGTGFNYRAVGDPTAARVDRVGVGGRARHTNGDANVVINIGTQTVQPTGVMQTQSMLVSTVSGTQLWGLSESRALPDQLITTPATVAGVAVPGRALFVRIGANVQTVRLPGLTFTTVGTGATTINADAQHLYIGKATGLGRCALTEIQATNTCTLAPMSADPVSAPLYITDTHVWYRSGTKVQRVVK